MLVQRRRSCIRISTRRKARSVWNPWRSGSDEGAWLARVTDLILLAALRWWLLHLIDWRGGRLGRCLIVGIARGTNEGARSLGRWRNNGHNIRLIVFLRQCRNSLLLFGAVASLCRLLWSRPLRLHLVNRSDSGFVRAFRVIRSRPADSINEGPLLILRC